MKKQELREIEERKQLKEEKEREIRSKSISDLYLFDRLKYRFFNLSIKSEDDPDGIYPSSSPPFFNTKIEQFKHELNESKYRLFYVKYIEEDMSDKEEFMQINRSRSHQSMIEEDFKNYLFACLRICKKNNKCEYNYMFISNYNDDLLKNFEGFLFEETFDKESFAENFMINNDNYVIDEKYAR